MSQKDTLLRRLVQSLMGALALLVFIVLPLNEEGKKEGAAHLAAEITSRISHITSKSWLDAHVFFPRGNADIIKKNVKPAPKTNTVESSAGDMRPLSKEEEARTRQYFAFIQDDDLPRAEELLAQMGDSVLLPYAQAALYLHPRNTKVSFGALHAWLTAYGDVPLAGAIYEKASRMRGEGGANLPRPRWKQGLSGNIEAMSGAAPANWKKSRYLSVVAKAKNKEEAGSDTNDDEEESVLENKTHSISITRAEELFRKGDMHAALGELAPLTHEAPVTEESAYGFWLKGLAATALGDRQEAFAAFAAAASTIEPAARAASAFWAARTAESLGDEGAAQHYYGEAARIPRSFYGKLALTRVGGLPEYNWGIPRYAAKHYAALMAHPAGARGLALLQIGRITEGEKELRGIHPRGDRLLEESLLAFANAASLPALSLQIAGALKKQGAAYDSTLYPTLSKEIMASLGSDGALVLAVARQESRFDSNVRSHRGATGFMQIMPDTAEKLEKGSSARLTDMATNIRLGDMYLQKLAGMKGINGSLIYTLAAYNCGPGRLLELAARRDVHGGDPLLFIETIPIKETRHYVQKVLQNYWVYQARMGIAPTSARVLAEGRMPSFTPAARVATK